MVARLSVAADLDFEVEIPGHEPVHGRLTGRGRHLQLDVDRPEAFAGSADAAAIRTVAGALAERGLRLRVVHGTTHLVSLGAVRAPWWQRRATGSRHIRLGSLRGAWTSGRARVGSTAPVLPDSTLLPPATLLPIAPTFRRRPRPTVTTTHDPARGGSPRLVLVDRESYLPGQRQAVYSLGDDPATIGSGPDCGIRLSGLAALHAEIVHDQDDEYVVLAHDPDTRVHGGRVTRQVLRTGARLQVGPWTLVFRRDEHADHGRPYGGRIGGELGHQRPQPPRPRADRQERAR